MLHNFGTLALRLVFGLSMALTHGLPKLINFSHKSSAFADPFDIGPVLSMAIVIFAEFFCAILVTFGAFTRVVAIPVAIVMGVAFFKIHAGTNFSERELAALFGAGFLAISLIGPGQFSFDYLVLKKR
ncbi:MAG: DoxX family protein [Deltaproteobacteria bacterium]|nr:DoxX family protein [Deltaproteobacteria bacterium]